ncbi:hypothetical protein [Bradyrhizobium sp. LMG 9283]|uniref:hypothetical protein n=1 Tax=Bradyrhizobium sp. LMG 9283 TaxID=592064 RepID=UPI0038910F5B
MLIASGDLIAGLLNRNGLKTANGKRWTRKRVTSMRPNCRIRVFEPAGDGIEPWLNLSEATRILKIAPKTLRLAAEAGEIQFFILCRMVLGFRPRRSHNVRRSIHHQRARQNPRHPAGSPPKQQNLFSSIT